MIAGMVVAASAAALLYIVFGYPILLGFLARRGGRPARRASVRPRISIIIPVYNGETFLAGKLRSVLALDYPHEQMEIVVVSDGSTDRTDAITREFEQDGVRLMHLERGGKPAALNAAIPTVSGEILVLTDVRQELAADSVGLLMESFADPSVGAVSGELIIRRGSTREESDIQLYWRIESWIRDRLSLLDSMFGATGPFYAIRRELAVPIPPDILLDDMYLPLTAFFRGYRLIMDARARAYDYPTSLDTEFRRKVRTLAGNYQLLRVFPKLLSPANRMWFHFVSYKFGRLLLPWCLLACGLASFCIGGPWGLLLLSAQGIFYALAAIDPWLGPQRLLKRLSSPARTFVTMMIATLQALSVFFVPARSLWKVTSASSETLKG